ncbi:MAG: hypothetical protein AAF657_01550 [Acidobacteriota bacterium]
MRRGNALFALISVLLASLGLFACNQVSEEELKAAKDAEDWAWLEQAKADLDGKRSELTGLRERIASGGEEGEEESQAEPATDEGEGAEGAAGEAPPTLDEQATALESEITKGAEEFIDRLIQFINEQGIGAEPTDIQRQALGMKSDEDILVAQEYITRGGEYQRAIDIYSTALVNDPGNEKLLAAKAHAEEFRYITEERLGTIKKDMTEAEVQALLGTPRTSNVREYDDGKRVGWYFPKEEPRGAAAAVFFQKNKDVLKVYKTDFDAVTPES